MENNRRVLTSVVKTTRMGQTGLRAVLHSGMDPELRLTLQQQLRGYDALEDAAGKLAEIRGWKLKKPDRLLQSMIEHMTWMKTGRHHHETRIADMVIQGNTQGMIKTLRDLHRFPAEDPAVQSMGQQLLECETEYIRQLKSFL